MERQVRLHVSFLFILVLLQVCSSSREQVLPKLNAANTVTSWQNGTLMYQGKAYSGTLYTLYPGTTDTAELAAFTAGKEHGTWKKFYPGGRLMERREFSHGQKTGLMQEWWPNGKPKLAYRFEAGEYQGTCREWAADGRLVREMNYEKGHEEGAQKLYYADGRIKSNYIIRNGRRYGLLGTKNCINVADSIPFN